MIFYNYHKKKQNWQKPLFLLVILFFLFFFGNFLAQSFSSPILSIVSPLSEGANRTGLGWLNLFSFFQAKSLLLQENKKLLQENLDLKLSLAIRRDLEKENQELKNQ